MVVFLCLGLEKMQQTAWPENKRLALSIVVNVEEGSELSVADGDRGPEPVDELGVVLKKPIRNFGNESNYQSVSYTHLTLPTNREV